MLSAQYRPEKAEISMMTKQKTKMYKSQWIPELDLELEIVKQASACWYGERV